MQSSVSARRRLDKRKTETEKETARERDREGRARAREPEREREEGAGMRCVGGQPNNQTQTLNPTQRALKPRSASEP